MLHRQRGIAMAFVVAADVPIGIGPERCRAPRLLGSERCQLEVAMDRRQGREAGRVPLPLRAELGQALGDLLLEVEAERTERRMAFMVQECASCDDEPVAVQAKAQAVVIVFVVAMAKALVEPANFALCGRTQQQAQPSEVVDVLHRNCGCLQFVGELVSLHRGSAEVTNR